MKKIKEFCPVCQAEIPETHKINSMRVCPNCSWSASPMESIQEMDNKDKSIYALWGTALAILIFFFQASFFGDNTVKIWTLKTAVYFNSADEADLKELVKACEASQQYTCMTDALDKLISEFPSQDPKLMAIYVNKYVKTKKYKKAIETIHRFRSTDKGNKKFMKREYYKIKRQLDRQEA